MGKCSGPDRDDTGRDDNDDNNNDAAAGDVEVEQNRTDAVIKWR